MPCMFTEVHCVINGKVQGVAYRDFAQRTAHEYGLVGWVTNKDNGNVEVFAQGEPDSLKLFIEELHKGPVLAKVDSVGVDWRTPKKLIDDFIVIF